jgi:O-antigen ligase
MTALLICGLCGAAFTAFPLVVGASYAAYLGIFLLAAIQHGKADWVLVLVLSTMGFWFVGGFLSGSIVGEDLLSLKWAMNDGRVLFYYLPILPFLILTADEKHVSFWTTLCTQLLLLGCLVAIPMVLSGRGRSIVSSGHHAVGALFGVLSVFFITRASILRRRKDIILALLSLLPVMASLSRTTVVGLAGVVMWLILRQRSTRALMVGATLGLLTLSIAPWAAPKFTGKTLQMLSSDLMARGVQTFSQSQWQPGNSWQQELVGKEWNILSRFVFWRYAWDNIVDSPLLGMGLGRFNDMQVEKSGEPGLAHIVTAGQRVTSVKTAHNTFLQYGAEGGLVGLGLVLSFWLVMYRRLGGFVRRTSGGDEPAALYMAGQAIIVFVALSGLTNHSMGAPVYGLCSLPFIGLGIAAARNEYGLTAQIAS